MVVCNTYLNFYFMCAAPKIKVNGIGYRIASPITGWRRRPGLHSGS